MNQTNIRSLYLNKQYRINKWSDFLYFVQFLNCCRRRVARELTSGLLIDAPSVPSFNTILAAHPSATQESLTSSWVTLHHLQSSLETSIKEGQMLPQNLLVAFTWKSPNFHLQFVSHLWCILHQHSYQSSGSFSPPAQRTSDWKSQDDTEESLIYSHLYSLRLLFFLADRWWNNISTTAKLPFVWLINAESSQNTCLIF